MWRWGGLGLVQMVKWVRGCNLEKLVLQTPLGVSSSTTVLKRVLFFTSFALLTSRPIEMR